jgi:hypothetical protein
MTRILLVGDDPEWAKPWRRRGRTLGTVVTGPGICWCVAAMILFAGSVDLIDSNFV